MAEEERITTPVVVPPTALAPATLHTLIQEFLIREAGQDHVADVDDIQVERVRQALRRQDVVITFDPGDETVALKKRDDLPPELRP